MDGLITRLIRVLNLMKDANQSEVIETSTMVVRMEVLNAHIARE